MGDLFDDIAEWFARVGGALGEVSVGLLLLALALMTLQSALDALAWRNILRAAYPAGGVRYSSVFGAYAGGVAINNVLPAQAGTIAMLGLYRGMIGGATVPGLVGAQAVQTLFYAVAGATVYGLLLVSRPDTGHVRFDALWEHPWLTVIAAAVAIAVAVLVVRVLRERLTRILRDAREGAAVMVPPRRYVAAVLVPQLGSYAARMCVIATLMAAYGLDVTPRGVLLMVAVVSLSFLFALTPGGVGTQQALAVIALRGAAPSATVAAYAIGQQVIITAWSIALGAVALSATIGWRATRTVVHERWTATRSRKASD